MRFSRIVFLVDVSGRNKGTPKEGGKRWVGSEGIRVGDSRMYRRVVIRGCWNTRIPG